jgi:protein TonB
LPLVPIAPVYPADAQLRHINGKVKLSFVIGKDGRPSKPTVLSSYPPGVFDVVSVQALLRSRFAPKCVDGNAVPVRSTFTYHYELQHSDSMGDAP